MFAPRLFNCVLNYVQESYYVFFNRFKGSKVNDIMVYNKIKPVEDDVILNLESGGDYLKSKYNPNVDWWSIEIENANNFDFTQVIPKDNTDFWVGKSCYIKEVDENGNINEVKTILHVKTNLVLSIDGELLGRNVNGEFVDVNNLPLDVKVWYQRCGF
jgi:hypothetical protein